MLNPIFSKKVQGQKHPGRRGIVEHQLPSIKVLFKTNAKGHKHPSIRLISKSKTQFVNQRKQKVAFNPGTAHSSQIQSYRIWEIFFCYTLASTKLKVGNTGFTLSVCPSVDRIVSDLYLQQYSSDAFHICTSNQATSEVLLCVMVVSKFKNLKFWRIL